MSAGKTGNHLMISDSKLLASAAWDAQSLNELKAKAGEDPAANIRPVARQVEGMFVQMMLKSMRDALPKDGLFSSEHTRLYTSMYDQQIAQQMTAGKGLGLAEMMVKQMTPEQPLPEESTPAAPMKFPLETVVRYQNQALSQLVQKAVPRNYDDSLPGDSKAFLAQLSLPAQLASQQSGVPHHLILAQAALESGWGQRQIRRENGEPSYNLFGVKASGNWKGPVTEITTADIEEVAETAEVVVAEPEVVAQPAAPVVAEVAAEVETVAAVEPEVTVEHNHATAPMTRAPAPEYVPEAPRHSDWQRPTFAFEGKGAAGGHTATHHASAAPARPQPVE
jgi:peptidoglycan hydrolase FlgJ